MAAATAAGDEWPGFSVRLTEDGGWPVLRVTGELDVTVAPTLRHALSAVRPGPGQWLVVDVSQLGFIDVSGVRLLITADQQLRAAGSSGLAVRGAAGIVRRVFELMLVTGLLEGPETTVAGVAPATGKLDHARREARMSVTDLYVAYFALGGTAELGEVAAYLAGAPAALDVHQRGLAVQAVNERLLDLGRADQLLSFHPTERGRDWT
jgi:anti-sigma B factor antagonist